MIRFIYSTSHPVFLITAQPFRLILILSTAKLAPGKELNYWA